IKTAYIHSDVDTLERVQIMDNLRAGVYDVLVGVNLLREGLDLPEVSLVAILDADKEGFLRSHRSLTQTVGRAARHLNGRAIMYGDRITDSMARTIEETNRRREKQLRYNEEHHITPQAIRKDRTMGNLIQAQQQSEQRAYVETALPAALVADPIVERMSPEQLRRCIDATRKKMEEAARRLDFVEAAQLRDEMLRMQAKLEG
ncbi:MAG: UvrB/UvrC motif-containing protein, partial [Bacteroidaceae bacterium]|nr:UvrB/UvrC motif-containing protein [Bacteroidaceae bacterium]